MIINEITSPKGKEMRSWVSPIYDNSEQSGAVFQANGTATDDMEAWVQDLRTQAFPQTATWSIGWWEEKNGITPDDTLDLQARRNAVMNKIHSRRTCNEQLIHSICEGRYGTGKITITVDYASATFNIKFSGVPDSKDEIEKTIREIKPAHMAVTFEYTYQTYAQVGTRTYDTLGRYTYKEIREGRYE